MLTKAYRRSLFFMGFIALLIFTNQLVAEVATENTGSAEYSNNVVQNPGLGPSEVARLNKQFGVAGRLGYVVGQLTGPGVEAFYNNGPRFQIGVQYLQGEKDLKSDLKSVSSLVQVEKVLLSSNTAMIMGRYFVGNSFNVYGGIGQRVIDWDFKISTVFGDSSVRSKGTVTSLIAGIGIGNTWYWDNGFFIGGDWLGYFTPLSSSKTVKTETTGTTSDDLKKMQKDGEDLGEKLGTAAHEQLAILNIGYMF